MIQRQRKGDPKVASTPPQKKVTFYGPVMTTKGEKLRHVGTKASPGKRTTFSSLTSTAKDMTTQPLHHKQSKSDGSEYNKPHSKTTVIGIPTMTRLNCNHLRPKCQCSNIPGRKMMNKVKHNSLEYDTPKRILTSTRSLPRGELNGRKSYKENSNSISILDSNWRPGLDVFSKDTMEGISTNQNSVSVINKENVENNKENKGNSKKKVQFEEKVNRQSGSRKKLNNFQNDNHLDPSREINESQRYSKDNDGHPDSQLNSHSTQPDNSKNAVDPPVAPSTSYPQPSYLFNDNDSSVSGSQARAAQDKYCRLCELSDHRFPQTSLYNKINYRSFDHHDKEYSSEHCPDHAEYSSKYEDPCLLCRRYGKQYYNIDSKDQCEKYNTDYSHTLTDSNKDTRSTFRKTRSPLHRKLSTPMLYSDREDDHVFARRIPYEPRTELVKNLKQKLEAEYGNDEHMLQRSNSRRRWRSWDAEDLEDLRHSHLHNYSKAWGHSSCHKCIHRYLQNDRLFLDPTVMDIDGQSVCVECGEPQPTDPEKDPFLYHITLGGMSSGGLGQNKDEKAWRHQPRVNLTKKADQHINYQKSRKSSIDTSKHIFAKLNKNINNILPSGSGYSIRPWATSKLRYTDPHLKRHPSKSMALVDHII